MDACILPEYLQVKPSSALDPCLSPVDEVATKLKSYVLGGGNKLDEFLNKGELSQAVQLSLSVLKSVNEENDCGQTHNSGLKRLVCKYTKTKTYYLLPLLAKLLETTPYQYFSLKNFLEN